MDFNKIPCDLCSETFVHKYKFETHYKKVHKIKPYLCIFCNKRFSQKRCLKDHYLRHTDEKPHSCDDCSESFSQRSGLWWHRRQKHGYTGKPKLSKDVKCEELDSDSSKNDEFSDAGTEGSSLQIPEEKPYKCDKCEKTFLLQTALDIHYYNEHPTVKHYICRECNTNFVNESALRKHYVFTHPDRKVPYIRKLGVKWSRQAENKAFKCDLCEKAFFRQRDYDLHYHREHPDEKLYKCPECSRSYIHELGLMNHVKSHCKLVQNSAKRDVKPTPDPPVQTFDKKCRYILYLPNQIHKCQTCDATFESVIDLGVHEMSHMNKQLYVCDMCNESFSKEQDLDEHFLTHEPKTVKVYVCKFCDKNFSERTHLRVHLLSHSGQSSHEIRHTSIKSGKSKMSGVFADIVTHSFKCHICKKIFSNKFDFYLHCSSHKPKEDQCVVCKRHFSNQADLCVHSLSHTDNASMVQKGYQCPVCNEHFSKEVDLRVHSLSHAKTTLTLTQIDQKEYQCLVCKEPFSNQADLRVHSLSHAEIYTCEVCRETFINAIDFKVHCFSHSDNPGA